MIFFLIFLSLCLCWLLMIIYLRLGTSVASVIAGKFVGNQENEAGK